jgi:hypothetical protein
MEREFHVVTLCASVIEEKGIGQHGEELSTLFVVGRSIAPRLALLLGVIDEMLNALIFRALLLWRERVAVNVIEIRDIAVECFHYGLGF